MQAILGRRRVRMRYHSFSSQQIKDYIVEPYRLAYAQGGLYLQAFVPEYSEMRTFAAQRIEQAVSDLGYVPNALAQGLKSRFTGTIGLPMPSTEISIRDVIHASELTTFDLHCVSHPVDEERCAASHECSIRPVWLMLQRRIDDVLESVSLADLLHDEPTVRQRVGLTDDQMRRLAPHFHAGMAHVAKLRRDLGLDSAA